MCYVVLLHMRSKLGTKDANTYFKQEYAKKKKAFRITLISKFHITLV